MLRGIIEKLCSGVLVGLLWILIPDLSSGPATPCCPLPLVTAVSAALGQPASVRRRH
jgi:hypothetical protein